MVEDHSELCKIGYRDRKAFEEGPIYFSMLRYPYIRDPPS